MYQHYQTSVLLSATVILLMKQLVVWLKFVLKWKINERIDQLNYALLFRVPIMYYTAAKIPLLVRVSHFSRVNRSIRARLNISRFLTIPLNMSIYIYIYIICMHFYVWPCPLMLVQTIWLSSTEFSDTQYYSRHQCSAVGWP